MSSIQDEFSLHLSANYSTLASSLSSKTSRDLEQDSREKGSGIRILKFINLHFSVIRIWCARLVIHPVPPRCLWNTFHFHFHKGKLWGSCLCVDVSEWYQHKWDEIKGEKQWVGTGAFSYLRKWENHNFTPKTQSFGKSTAEKSCPQSLPVGFLSSGTTAACVGTWDVFSGFIKPVMSLLACNKCSCCLQTVPGSISNIAMKITPLMECVLLLCQSFPKEKPKISLKRFVRALSPEKATGRSQMCSAFVGR